ncbi:MAG TPA: PPC domain-containing protein [Candidatus Limnocylindrales bacterium]|nr:PPC domain-containing protein [Candidatus Limnocylindrales bacterium]
MLRLWVWIAVGMAPAALAQVCPSAPLASSGTVSGNLAVESCTLSDGTAYDAYRVVLPLRGQLQAALTGSATAIVRDATGAQVASGTSLQTSLEAGSYAVIVNGSAPAAYTLQTTFTAEPGMLCTVFPALGLNQTANGSLGSSGCAAPDGSPYEAYSLSTFGPGTLTAKVTSSAFSPVISVRSGDGVLIATGAGFVTLPVDAASSYRVVVSSSDTTGAYQIVTSLQTAAGSSCGPASSYNDSGNDSAAITPESCSVIIDDSGDQAFFTYYLLNVTAAGLADLSATSTDFSPTLYLLDAAGNQIAIDSGGGGTAGNSRLRVQLAPGTYIAQVFSNYTSGGNYSFTYQFTAGTPQPCATAALSAGATNGQLAASSCRTALGLTDLYSITVPAAGTLTLDLQSRAFTGQIAIRDTKDNLIVLNQDFENLGDAHLAAALAAGTYTVAASAISGAGAYQLSADFQQVTLPGCTFVQPLSLNGGYIANLLGYACFGPNGYPVDTYQFTLPSDSTIAAVMTSSDLDGSLTLQDSTGAVLRTDDNSYGNGDPLIVQFLPAGTYRLAARGASSNVGGLYQVTLLASPGPRAGFCASKAPLTPGAPVSGVLTYTGCQYPDGTFADIYQINIAAAATVDLKLKSPDFDAYLVLQDAKGNVVATDDDSGGGTDARIQQPLQPGTYYVYAKPFANYYSVGNYTLSLSLVAQ